MRILVLESSTTSAKAMLYDTDEKNYKVKTRAYSDLVGGSITHDAERVFLETMDLGKHICQKEKVDMISLSGTWHSLMLCDKNMIPKTPVYLWSYIGASNLCKKLREDQEYVRRYYHKTGCMVNGIYPFFKLLHLKEMGHKIEDSYIMGQGTYTMYRLTGKRVITECMASGTGLLNIHDKKFDKTLLEEVGIKDEQLSRLVTYDKVFPLTVEGAKLLDLQPGIPVIAANADGGLNQVGVGALEEGIMTFSVGTSGAVRLTVDQAIIPDMPSTWCYLSPKAWLSGAATSGCCNCIDWFKNQVAGRGVTYSDLETKNSVLENTPVFLPFLFGERCLGWDDERKGGFLGLEPYHTKQDMYRAVQEGVLFNLYQCYETLSKVNGVPKKIKLSGGILHSKVWLQMCVDIFGVKMEIDDVQHGSLLGGAVLAMELLGVIPDARDFKTGHSKIIKPNMDNVSIYKEKYERYLKYYYGTY